MRKKTFTLLSLLGLCSISQSTLANDIEPTKEFYTAVRAPAPIVLDGNLAEWSGAPVLADPKFSIPKGSGDSGTLVLFEEYAGGTWSGPDDQTSAVQVVYDDNNVYFGFVVTDDYHENAANSAWNGDSVQLMIANANRDAQVALYNYALGGIEGETTEVIVMHEAGPGETEAVVTRNGTTKKTVYEIKLPASALGLSAPLTAGTKFGLGMAINDGDSGTGQEGQKGWGGLGAHSIVFGKTPAETASVTLGASQPTIEVLGVGVESLLGSDLTDPENDGDETAGAASPTWNWAAITASHEPDFGGGEFAFNIFDNAVGGGNDKWCCDDPTLAAPVWVSVQFPNPVSLTHFTVTSGNDAADRDPTNWAIQGSSDGQNFTDIYHPNASPALWTERLQVIKFTLPTPSAPYRHIRYIAYETPGTLHQLTEVEYFGTFGGADVFFLSAINPTVDSFNFRATDVGTSIVAPATAKLTLDGQNVTLTSTKTGDATDFKYTPASPFPPNSDHAYTIEVRDTLGNIVTSSGNFRTIAYALLTPDLKVTADTTKPGFIWNVHQNPAATATANNRVELQLAGLAGENFADPAAQGPALAPGTAGANSRLPIRFEIETVINLDQAAGSSGDITPDDQMPGIPSLSATGQTDGIAGEIITYIDLPAGRHTFIVNSDDNFRTTAGNINDVFRAQVAGEFNAGRGATDTPYTVFVQEAGIYAFRTIWGEGGGGANIEWKSTLTDGTEVLINDFAGGGFRSYRAATGLPTAINSIIPIPNTTSAAGDTAISASILEGAAAVDVASVRLTFNGAPVTATATKTGNLVSISYQPPALLAPRSTNTASVTYTAGGTARTENWTFVVANYGFLTASMRVTPDTTKPGFIWNVHQNPTATATVNNRVELQLSGALGVNFADPAAQGPALAPGTPGAAANLPIRFEIETVINLDQGAGSNGEFQPDDQMPGIPSLSETGQTDGIAGEVLTFIELPAGKNTLIVNSDDNFRTTAGPLTDIFDAQVLGEFNAGRGASDTIYEFFVEQAGVYPFRTIWGEGGGGANIEWKLQKADGSRVLINDVANGGPRAYRAATAAASAPAIIRVSPAVGTTKAIATAPVEVVIQQGTTTVDNGSIQLSVNGSQVTPAINTAGQVVTVSYQPPAAFGAKTTNSASIRFTVGGVERIEQWSFVVPPVTLDEISDRPALILGSADYTPDAAGRSGQAGDKAIDLGRGGGTPSVLIPDASFVNATTAGDVMTFSVWVKKYDNANSSIFWADSPTSPSGQRGFQAHTPWSDNNVYFDTAGCCAAEETRISAGIDTFTGFTGPEWWTNWHHWAFVKNVDVKQIYIDGQLFLEGGGTTDLPADFTRIWLGAEGGGADNGVANNMHGQFDDFAVFGTALSAADVGRLFNGTLPSALGAATKPLAHWDFNGAPISGDRPTLTITRAAGGATTISWPADATGFKLRSATAVTGPFADVAGVTGNSHVVANPTGTVFYILQQ